MCMRSLRRKPDGELARRFIEVGHTATGLNWCRMNTRYIHFLLDHNPFGFGLGKGSIGPFTITRFPMVDLVGWLLIFFVRTQQWRIGIQGLLGIHNHGERLVLDFDGSSAIGSRIAAGSHDKSDFLHLE